MSHRHASRPRPTGARPWRALAGAIVLICGAGLFAACDDGGGGTTPAAVVYFPAGGVSEQMGAEHPSRRLSLDHTVVLWLESSGGGPGDVGTEDGVDDVLYHFDRPTRITLSLDLFEEAPDLVALDRQGREVARVSSGSGDATITLDGEHTIRLVHPHAGDASAAPILVFLHPVTADAADAGAQTQANPNDVVTLKASKNCPNCDLSGLSWNACPGATLSGLDLSHANFTSANLACLTFQAQGQTPTLLTGAIFDDASLNQVTFSGVELTDAHFSGTTFQIATLAGVTATAADFGGSRWQNSTFGAVDTSGSSAREASFRGAAFGPGACLSAQDLRAADFTGASFDSASSVNGTWFAGANLFDVTFDGTRFRWDASLPRCGPPQGCTAVNAPGLCADCPCHADLGCLALGSATECVQNQGPVSLSTPPVCQRAAVQAAPEGLLVRNADLSGVSFAGADLTNSTFGPNALDQTTDFAGAILAGVDFSREDLGRSVDLSTAVLSETTNFAGAGLSDYPNSQQGVNLSCVVTGNVQTGGCQFPAQTTELKGANLQYAQLNNAGLTEANLEGAVLDGAFLVGAKLNFANLKGASLVGAHLGTPPNSNPAAVLAGAYMINVDLTDADLRSVDLTGAHVYGAATDALFVRTLLDGADFTNAILDGAVFTDANLPGAVFNGAQLVDASFDGATLSNAKLDSAYLQGADFSTAKSVQGLQLTNAAVSTTLTSQRCTLTPPGAWMYTDQDGVPYTYAFGATKLQTDATVVCPNGSSGPCVTGDSLCPLNSGPFPPVPPCVPAAQFCYENCLMPPCFKDMPNPQTQLCPTTSNCSEDAQP